MRNSSGVYKITNTVSGDFYIGSTKHFVSIWGEHRRPTMWKIKPNNRICIYGGKQVKFKALSSRIGYSAASKCLVKESV